MKKYLLMVLALTSLGVFAATVQTGQVISSTDIKTEPSAAAATVAALDTGAAVEVGERKGAWYRIKSTAGTGWVRMLNIRLGATRAEGESFLAGVAALGNAGRSDTTVATGVRGLSREDLKNAPENRAEVARLDQYRVSAVQAQQFGATAGLPAPGQGE